MTGILIIYNSLNCQATNQDFMWKLFGIIVTSLCIIICTAVLVFILLYTYRRSEKYKKALKEELKNTDENGNPVKETEISRIYKHTTKTLTTKPKRSIRNMFRGPPTVAIPKPTMQMIPVSRPPMTFRNIVQRILPQKMYARSAESSQFLMSPNPTPIMMHPSPVAVTPQPIMTSQMMINRPQTFPKPQSQQLVMVQQHAQPQFSSPQVVMQNHVQPQFSSPQVVMQHPAPQQQAMSIFSAPNYVQPQQQGYTLVQAAAHPNLVSPNTIQIQPNNFQSHPLQTVTVPISYNQP